MQIIVILCFLSYLLLVLQYKLLAGKGAKDLTGVLLKNVSLQLLNKRTIATIPLMLLCIVFYSTDSQNHFLQAAWSEKATFATTLLVSICLLVSVYSTDQFKKIRTTISIKDIIIYFILRIPGLVIYEIFFRGVILEICLEQFSVVVAILLNVGLYAVAHAFGSRKEFLGSIPFGFLLCYITVLNQSVYPAVLIHLVLALPYEAILFTKCQLLTKKFEP